MKKNNQRSKILKAKECLDSIIDDLGYEAFVNGLVLLEEGRTLTEDEYSNYMNHSDINLLSLSEILNNEGDE